QRLRRASGADLCPTVALIFPGLRIGLAARSVSLASVHSTSARASARQHSATTRHCKSLRVSEDPSLCQGWHQVAIYPINSPIEVTLCVNCMALRRGIDYWLDKLQANRFESALKVKSVSIQCHCLFEWTCRSSLHRQQID